MPRERWYWVAAGKSCSMPFARSAGRTRSDECSRGKSRWSIRNVMPPPQPEVRMRSVTLPTERILTSGCGGGITFRIDHRLFPRLHSSLRVRPADLANGMEQLFPAATQYQRSRGIHGAAPSAGRRLLVAAEDVGRHNAVDRVRGRALREGIPTADRILLSTGRVSSEMLLKAARMGVPVVASRTSPTEMAVALAEQLNVTVCGYVRPDGLNLYAGEALVLDAEPATRG